MAYSGAAQWQKGSLPSVVGTSAVAWLAVVGVVVVPAAVALAAAWSCVVGAVVVAAVG